MKIGKFFSNVIANAIGGAGGVLGYNAYKGVKKQRDTNRGYVEDSYNFASQEMGRTHELAQQNAAESLNARGLLTQGAQSPIHAAMVGSTMKATGPAPTSLGEQLQSDNAVQMALERRNLSQQRDRAIRENKTEFADNLIGMAMGAGKNAASLALGAPSGDAGGLSAALGGGGGGSPSPVQTINDTPIHTAMGVQNPLIGAYGVHVTDPLNHPESSFYTGKQSSVAFAQSNAEFNTGGV